MAIVNLSSPQSILLLGDIAAYHGYDALTLAIAPSVAITLTKLTSKTYFIHFVSLNLHVELSEQTPVVPKETPHLIKQIIELSHSVLINTKLDFGIDIKVSLVDVINDETGMSAHIVDLILGIAKLSSIELSKEDVLNQCLHYMQLAKVDVPFFTLGACIYAGFNFIDTKEQIVIPLEAEKMMLLSLPLSKPQRPKINKEILKHISTHVKKYKGNLELLGKLATLGKIAMEKGDLLKFGEYISRTQKLLVDFGLVNEQAHKLCIQSILSGALGAKYSLELDAVLVICDQKGIEVRAELMKKGIEVMDVSLFEAN